MSAAPSISELTDDLDSFEFDLDDVGNDAAFAELEARLDAKITADITRLERRLLLKLRTTRTAQITQDILRKLVGFNKRQIAPGEILSPR
jgi:hypothetical protein